MPPSPKVALVTGCTAGGIGHAIAQELHNNGFVVYATARRPDAIDPVPDAVASSGRWKTLAIDVTSVKSIQSGLGAVGPVAEIKMEFAKKVFETNVFGVLSCCQAVIPTMAEAGSGLIVNIGSIVGLVAPPWSGLYSSSKAAVHSMSEALKMELAPFGINVMVVAPGAIKSNMGTNSLTNLDLDALKLFKPYEEHLKARALASQPANATPTADFAQMVVKKMLSPAPPAFFSAGTFSTMFWLFTCLPRWVGRWMLMRMGGLNGPIPGQQKVTQKDE
eukprot:gene10262-8181_t